MAITKEQLDNAALDNCTCLMQDGKIAMLIRNAETEGGFQVPGEEDIRWVCIGKLSLVGNALIEA